MQEGKEDEDEEHDDDGDEDIPRGKCQVLLCCMYLAMM